MSLGIPIFAVTVFTTEGIPQITATEGVNSLHHLNHSQLATELALSVYTFSVAIWPPLSPSCIALSYSPNWPLTTHLLCLHSQATGIQLGTLVEAFSGILIALFVAHSIYGWTTWLILWVVLILVLARILQVKAFTGYTTKHATGRKKTLENAGKVSHLVSSVVLVDHNFNHPLAGCL